MSRELHVYDYVNHPYTAVRDAVVAAPQRVFSSATSATGAPRLEITVGAVELSTEIAIEVLDVTAARSPDDRPATHLALRWTAARNPAMFPTMTATLAIYALTSTETQLELSGSYEPPLGLAGQAIDAISLHGVAARSVETFLREVAAYLRTSVAHAA